MTPTYSSSIPAPAREASKFVWQASRGGVALHYGHAINLKGGLMRGKLQRKRGQPRSASPEPSLLQDDHYHHHHHQQQQPQQQYTMRPPQPYMKQIKLHPSGCQQWSSQVRCCDLFCRVCRLHIRLYHCLRRSSPKRRHIDVETRLP